MTTNGILILHPDKSEMNGVEEQGNQEKVRFCCVKRDEEQLQNMFKWREVSVDGDIYTLRTTRASATRGDHVRNECNELEVGFSKVAMKQ